MSAVAERKPYKLWIRLGIIAALLMGMLFTGARGGWTGLAVGILFLMVRIRPNARTVLATVFAITVATATISLAPAVRDRFGQIFNTSMASPTMQRLGVTDQERVSFWLWEGRKMRKSPFLGAGFYNRGEVSGLSPFGSHNFFIQMGLETGLIGLFCVLWLLKALWSSASSAAVDPALRPHAVAFQSSLLAACVASLSGEYLYGGIPVFILSVLYSTMIALKRVQAESELSVQRSEVVLPGQQPAPDELGAGACWRATRWPAG
jgi:O-antigen ligase